MEIQPCAFKTSGTTGTPKTIVYNSPDSIKRLIDSVRRMIDAYGGESGDVLFTYEPDSIGHIIVKGYCSETKSKCFTDPEGSDPVYLVGTGSDVVAQLHTPMPNLKYVIVMRGIVEYREEIEELLPEGAKLFATYGSTEIGAFTTSENLDEGYITNGDITIDENGEILYNNIKSGDRGSLLPNKNLALFVERIK